jgi:periplasmic protein TonB
MDEYNEPHGRAKAAPQNLAPDRQRRHMSISAFTAARKGGGRAGRLLHRAVIEDDQAAPAFAGNSHLGDHHHRPAHLNAYKAYPYDARIHRQQGTVGLRFTLDRSGKILSCDVTRSAGSPSLDEEARAMMRRANPFPPLPKEFQGQTLELEVPVIFALH